MDGHVTQSGDAAVKKTNSETSRTRLSSITEDGYLNNSVGSSINPSSSIVTSKSSVPVQGSKCSGRPRSYALSTPNADHISNAITVSLTMGSNHRLSKLHDKNLSSSLPDLTAIKVDTGDNPVPVARAKGNQPPTKDKRKAIFGKKRALSYISDDERYILWQCAGCQQLNESDKMNCKGCGGPVGIKAIGESLCKGCKVKVYISDIEILRSDSNCPMCEMPLGNTKFK